MRSCLARTSPRHHVPDRCGFPLAVDVEHLDPKQHVVDGGHNLFMTNFELNPALVSGRIRREGGSAPRMCWRGRRTSVAGMNDVPAGADSYPRPAWRGIDRVGSWLNSWGRGCVMQVGSFMVAIMGTSMVLGAIFQKLEVRITLE
jgi:hypothetical protein